MRELLKELEINESESQKTEQQLKQEFYEYKMGHEKVKFFFCLPMNIDLTTQERHALMEIADDAHKLQMKAQKTAEEAMNHLRIYMSEQEKLVMHCKPLCFLLARLTDDVDSL